jgi:hypothetical protein
LEDDKATLKVRISPIRGSEAYPVTMAKIAKDIYNFRTPIGWNLGDRKVDMLDNQAGRDYVGLYVNNRDGSCVLALQVSGSWALNHDNWVKKGLSQFASDPRAGAFAKGLDDCGGYRMAKGFGDKLFEIMETADWRIKIQKQVKDMCSGSVTAVGHSLGGTLATILTACANDPEENRYTKHLGFQVKGLYTIGAAAVSKEAIWNKTEGNPEKTCLEGLRIFSASLSGYDPIAYFMQATGFAHPHMPAERIWEDDSVVHRKSFGCGSDIAVSGSKIDPLTKPKTSAHNSFVYARKLAIAYKNEDFTWVPTLAPTLKQATLTTAKPTTPSPTLALTLKPATPTTAEPITPSPTLAPTLKPATPTTAESITPSTPIPAVPTDALTDAPTASPPTDEPTEKPSEETASTPEHEPTRRPTECWQKGVP